MIKLIDLLNEGVRDPGIFKAVFLAGGPGSGKSYVAQQLFGIPEKVNVSKTGLKNGQPRPRVRNASKKILWTRCISRLS